MSGDIYQLNDAPVDFAPPPHPPNEVLTGETIELQPLLQADCFDALYAQSHGDAAREAVWQYMPYGPFADVAAMRACYEKMSAGAGAEAVQFYAVRQLQSGECTGVVSYLRIAPAAYSIEIGHIWHAIATQRTRANTEASYLQIKNAFALGYRRVEWKCNALNEKSRRAALRLGFAFEGIFRQQTVFKGKNRDTAWFALIDKDWSEAENNFRQWFAAEAGKTSLAQLNKKLAANSSVSSTQ